LVETKEDHLNQVFDLIEYYQSDEEKGIFIEDALQEFYIYKETNYIM
jgi:hypothetical protein